MLTCFPYPATLKIAVPEENIGGRVEYGKCDSEITGPDE
jgi:hypothetical protein